jgi:hypothetical protein
MGGDGDARPVKIAVVPELSSSVDRHPDEPAKGRRRAALGTDQRRARHSQFRAGPPQRHRVLTHEDPRAGDLDRMGGQLVQGHLERRAVPRRAGQPLTQPLPSADRFSTKTRLARSSTRTPARSHRSRRLHRGPRTRNSSSHRERPQDEGAQSRPMIERLRVPGDPRGQRGRRRGPVPQRPAYLRQKRHQPTAGAPGARRCPRVASLFAGDRACQRTDGGIVAGPRGLVLPAGPGACPGIFGGGVKDARTDRISTGGKYPAHVLSGRGSTDIGCGRPAAQRRARPGPGRQWGGEMQLDSAGLSWT